MAAVAVANAGMVHMPASAGPALTSCRTLIAFLDEEDYALKGFALENLVRLALPPFWFGCTDPLGCDPVPNFFLNMSHNDFCTTQECFYFLPETVRKHGITRNVCFLSTCTEKQTH
jgi:hypothetical protein